MRTDIPYNKVKCDYKAILREFVEMLEERQRDNLVCVYLTGSYARGDATDSSDLDVFCIFERIDPFILRDVGFCTNNLSVLYSDIEVNPQAISLSEFMSDGFGEWGCIEYAVRELDSVLLYGEFPLVNSPNNIEYLYKRYMSDVLMSIRHYICVDEPKEKLTYSKIKTYILKMLLIAMRLERYTKTGVYPISTSDLLEAYSDDRRILVEYYTDPQKLQADVDKDHRTVLSGMHDAVKKMILE